MQRGAIDALCQVRLLPHPRGVKAFNPETVQITSRSNICLVHSYT